MIASSLYSDIDEKYLYLISEYIYITEPSSMEKRYAQYDEILGQIVSTERKKLGLDQKELAKILEINQPALSRIERGESAVSVAMLLKLSDAFKMPASQLIERFQFIIERLREDSISVVPKKEIPKDDPNLGKMLLVGGALALLLTAINK